MSCEIQRESCTNLSKIWQIIKISGDLFIVRFAVHSMGSRWTGRLSVVYTLVIFHSIFVQGSCRKVQCESHYLGLSLFLSKKKSFVKGFMRSRVLPYCPSRRGVKCTRCLAVSTLSACGNMCNIYHTSFLCFFNTTIWAKDTL